MRKLFVILSLLTSTMVATAAETFSGLGAGTADSPYEITKASHLDEVRNFLNDDGVYFILEKDIDLEVYLVGLNWEPLGSASEPFKGVFLGNGHTISGITINTSSDCQGLFGCISGATIRDLTVEGTVKGADKVGGIVGYALGTNTIDNCIFNGNITGHEYTGGIAGVFEGEMSNVKHTGNTKGYGNLGGIVGLHPSGSLSWATNTGDVTCLSSGTNSYVGGVVGRTYCAITSSANSGRVTGKMYVGGLAGAIEQKTDMVGCTSDGNVTGTDNTGGLIGYMDEGSITGCTSEGVVSGNEKTGGLIGQCKATVNGCSHTEGNVTGTDYVGGLIGMATASVVDSRVNAESVSGENLVGGLVGQMSNGSITNCQTYTVITGNNNVGGMVGFFQMDDGKEHQISSSGFFGYISAVQYVGGILGQAGYGCTTATKEVTKPDVLHSYKTYSASAEYDKTYQDTMTELNSSLSIANCAAEGDIVASGSFAGGIIGKGIGGENITEVYTSVLYTRFNNNHTLMESYAVNKVRMDPYGYEMDGHFSSTVIRYNDYVPTFKYCTYTYNSAQTSVTDNYYSGNLSGADCVGGIAGYMHGGTVSHNYSNASVEGANSVGGIIGSMQADLKNIPTAISGNAALGGSVSALADAGKVYGSITGDYITISTDGSGINKTLKTTNLFLNGAVQDTADNSERNGSVRMESEMLNASSYTDMEWSFGTGGEWAIDEGVSYPYKQWQTATPTIVSGAVKGSTTLSGTCADDGKVYVGIEGTDAVYEASCSGGRWAVSVPALISGKVLRVWCKYDGKEQSNLYYASVSLPGNGTMDSPWLVYDADDLQGVAKNKNGYYRQATDIDLTEWISANSPEKGWLPVCVSGEMPVVFDGADYKVTGLWTNTTKDCTGLFSSFTAGTIRNLTVETGDKQVKGGDYTGVVIGRIGKGVIENVTAKGNVSGGGFLGGVAGYTEGTALAGLSYSGRLSATGHVGGITSVASQAEFSRCEVSDVVIEATASQFVGGLVAFPVCAISKCKVTGSITLSGTHAEACVGGLAGRSSNAISQCMTDVTISSASPSGITAGLVAFSGKSVSECVTAGSITSTGVGAFTGGMIGQAGINAVVENCYSTADVSGTRYVGGIAGYAEGSIINTYSTGNMLTSADDAQAGGIVGFMEGSDATVRGCVALNQRIETGSGRWGHRIVGGIGSDVILPETTDNCGWNEMPIISNGTSKTVADNQYEGTAMTTSDMHKQDAYESMGWDFKSVWFMEEATSLPRLIWETGQGDIVDPTADYIVLDENSTSMPETATSVGVRVKRTIKGGEWSTICLPFAMTEEKVKEAFGSGVQLGDFTGYEASEDEYGNVVRLNVKFKDVTAIEANHPYIIKVDADIVEFLVADVDITPEEEPTVATVKRTRKQWSEMTGTYVAGTLVESKCLFLSGGKFWYSVGRTHMKGYRAWFDFYDVLYNVDEAYDSRVCISFGDSVSGMHEVEQTGRCQLYDLTGRPVGGVPAKHGIYIKNGKKIMK